MSDSHGKPKKQIPAEPVRFGLLAEFEDVDTLLHAAAGVRDAGLRRWDSHTPFPVHGLDKAMGLTPTRLPWIVFCCGLTGATIGLCLQLYTMATELPGLPSFAQGYPMIISGKPFASVPAFIPVTFELTILLSAFGSFFGMLLMNGLPRHYHPTLRSERFRRVTNDRFFISVEADDPVFDWRQTRAMLENLGASAVEELHD